MNENEDPATPCPRQRPPGYDGPVSKAPYLDNPPPRKKKFRWYHLDRAAIKAAGKTNQKTKPKH